MSFENICQLWEKKQSSELLPLELSEVLEMKLPPREMILSPILPSKGLAMLYAPRGIGKTFLAMHMAYAAASGTSCLGWEAPKPRRVLYIDGEMPASDIQQRLRVISNSYPPPQKGNFSILSSDLLEFGVPDLSLSENWDKFQNFITRVVPCF